MSQLRHPAQRWVLALALLLLPPADGVCPWRSGLKCQIILGR